MVEWIVGTINDLGYAGIFFLMALENIFPPIPSELIMPFAGFAAARGDLSVAGVIAAGTAGTVVGNIPWYVAGHALGHDRLRRLTARWGRVLTIAPADVDRAVAWFNRYGWLAVLGGRLIPAVRTIISAPAGVARLPIGLFLAVTTLGSAAFISALTLAGVLLESQYETVEAYVNPISKLVLALIVGSYVYRLLRGYGRSGTEAG